MISVLQSAQLSSAIYQQNPSDWDHLIVTGDVVAGLKTIDGQQTLTIKGSASANDWLHDLAAVPVFDKEIGMVHAGFVADVDEALAKIQPLITGALTIQGHSLGGARARIMAGKLLVRKCQVVRVCVFGSPKPAFINLARILQKSGVEHVSFRNRNDVVPTVPFSLPFLEFSHTEPWQVMNEAPEEDNLDALRDHSMDLYLKGAEKFS